MLRWLEQRNWKKRRYERKNVREMKALEMTSKHVGAGLKCVRGEEGVLAKLELSFSIKNATIALILLKVLGF